MALRLAWQCGEPDVDALLARMTAAQFREWCAFYELEPWGPVQEDLRAGLLCSLTQNLWSEGRKVGPDHFFPSLRGKRRRQTVEEQILAMRQWAAGVNARRPPAPPAPPPAPPTQE